MQNNAVNARGWLGYGEKRGAGARGDQEREVIFIIDVI